LTENLDINLKNKLNKITNISNNNKMLIFNKKNETDKMIKSISKYENKVRILLNENEINKLEHNK
jgi:hypothetical protein